MILGSDQKNLIQLISKMSESISGNDAVKILQNKTKKTKSYILKELEKYRCDGLINYKTSQGSYPSDLKITKEGEQALKDTDTAHKQKAPLVNPFNLRPYSKGKNQDSKK